MIPAAAGHPPRAQIIQLGAHHGCQDQTAAADQIGGSVCGYQPGFA